MHVVSVGPVKISKFGCFRVCYLCDQGLSLWELIPEWNYQLVVIFRVKHAQSIVWDMLNVCAERTVKICVSDLEGGL